MTLLSVPIATLGMSVLLMGWGDGALAQSAPRRTDPVQRTSETCSLNEPMQCVSCTALSTEVGSVDPASLSAGKYIDGILWTPLFVAYNMNCQDVGRSLVKRGADVALGGRNGSLFVEVASQRLLNPDPKNSNINAAWASIIETGVIDIDAIAGTGGTGRQQWAKARELSLTVYPEIWTRFERRSVATPIALQALDFDPDFPTNQTGKTRPAESPVSKGVESFAKVFRRTGMAGVSAEVSGCYTWAAKIPKPSGRRVAFEHCAAMDIAAQLVDEAAAAKMHWPPTPNYEPGNLDARLLKIRDQAFEGLIYPIYRANLISSVSAWLGYFADLPAQDAPPRR